MAPKQTEAKCRELNPYKANHAEYDEKTVKALVNITSICKITLEYTNIVTKITNMSVRAPK